MSQTIQADETGAPVAPAGSDPPGARFTVWRAGFDHGACYKGNEMDPRQFAELHAKCWETLKHYVHEADRMCELFGQCLPEPSAIHIRSDIMEQRVRENNAYRSYTDIRRQLLEAVRIGYDPST